MIWDPEFVERNRAAVERRIEQLGPPVVGSAMVADPALADADREELRRLGWAITPDTAPRPSQRPFAHALEGGEGGDVQGRLRELLIRLEDER